MHAIIDVAQDVGAHAHALAQAGVNTVIRYYNHGNSPRHPSKCLTAAELAALHAAGLSVAVVFEAWGGAPRDGAIAPNISDLTAATGQHDGTRALHLAQSLSQPAGSAIYFAVDYDFTAPSDLASIDDYFAAVAKALAGAYKVGVYGSGRIARRLRKAGRVEHIWLGASGWSDTKDQLASGDWSLFQKYHNLTSPVGGFGYDGNIVNPARADFGQFGPANAGFTLVETPRKLVAKAQFEVIARSGLKLRAGPDTSYAELAELPLGTIVDGLARRGDWVQVDLEGDGAADGFMHGAYLAAVAGGLPVPLPPGSGRRPIDYARAEQRLDIHEWPGEGSSRNENNPQIMMYFTSTGYPAPNDEEPWCSAFVNYCVERAGLKGTDSVAALSWHEKKWGHDVTTSPQEGDIVVFSRRSKKESGGHVGFYLSETNGMIKVLGGNQSDSVCEESYPKDGVKRGTTYKLLSIRRA